MTIDELIARLMRLSEESPRGSATEVLLRFEGDLEVEGVRLGRAQSPQGRVSRSPVVLIQAGTARRAPITRRMPAPTDGPGGEPDDQVVQNVHADATRHRLVRSIARWIARSGAAAGGRTRPLEQLLLVLDPGRVGLHREDADPGQLRLFDGLPGVDLARARAICDSAGATVVHAGSEAVYLYATDTITMPAPSRYRDPLAYFTTRFHLTAHWAEKRLGWSGPDAEGKLVAVLASYLLADAAGVPVVDIGEYREFCGAWLSDIRTNPGFLDRLLDQSFKVADFILEMGGEDRAR